MVRHGQRRKKPDWGPIVSLGLLLIYVTITLLPMLWLIITSFKQQVDIFTYPPRFVFPWTLAHYQTVISESRFPAYVVNSIIVAVLATGASLTLGALAAYSLARFRSPIKQPFLFGVLLLRIVPPMALIVPFFLMLRAVGLFDSVFGLALIYLSFNLPLTIWLLTTYFAEVPASVEEAALIDGCSRLQALWYVVLPMTAPGLVAASIINVIFCWNEFPFALMLTARTARTAPVSITEWLVERGLLWGELAAAGTLIILPVIIFAFFVQRYLIQGLTMGAVKE